jgi:5-methylcytosine-specific restriction protein A
MMALSDVTHAGVLAAAAEFDRLGRAGFLSSTGFDPAKAYFLEYDGELYDSKAIIGYAHGVSTGVQWGPDDFSGGDQSVARRLRALGFTVLNLRQDWQYDEIVLACLLAADNGWRQVYDTDPRAHELSQLLQSPAIHPFPHHPDFRTPGGVGQKTRNIIDRLPDHRGSQSHGNRLDKKVLDDFLDDQAAIRARAARVLELLTAAASGAAVEVPDLDSVDLAAEEGGVALRAHLRRERDPQLRRRKLAETKRCGLPIACEACAFDFGRTYGPYGLDYIECHHRTPLYVTGKTQTRLADLALLCSNCHRMIHRSKRWLTVEELKELVDAQRKLMLSESPKLGV